MIATLLKHTRQTRVLITISILTGGALFLVLLLRSGQTPAPAIALPGKYDAILEGENFSLQVSVADSPEEREQGLSGITALPEGAGKLFVFDIPGRYGFWMKDMRYDLDIVWLNEDFRIVGITQNARADSYPEIFYPPTDILYAVEVPAGFSTAHHLSENQLLVLRPELTF